MEITTIGVIGAGQMGAGIAHVAALSGYNCSVFAYGQTGTGKTCAGTGGNG